MTKYLADAIKARQLDYLAGEAQSKKEAAAQQKFEVEKNLHPAIGALVTAKGVKYYARIDGKHTEGTVEELTALLNGK